MINSASDNADVQNIINNPDGGNGVELVIGPDNNFKDFSTSRLLYHGSPNVNHWYNAMRHYYKINNSFTKRHSNLASLKLLVEYIINISTNGLGGGANMEWKSIMLIIMV